MTTGLERETRRAAGVVADPTRAFERPGQDHWTRLARLERLAHALDGRYRIPGTSIRFGWDSILGLIPGIGDIAPLGPAGYILLEGHRLGVPTGAKLRMAGWTALDWAVGSVPIIGDILDVGIKSNRRNVGAIRRHLESVHGPAPHASDGWTDPLAGPPRNGDRRTGPRREGSAPAGSDPRQEARRP